MNIKKVKKIITLIVILIVLMTGCTDKDDKQTIIDERCSHEWVEVECSFISGEIYYDIYCPKCKSEKNKVTSKEWEKIQADYNYELKLQNQDKRN